MLRRREPWEPQDLASMGPPPLPGPDTAIALLALEPPPPVPSPTGSRTLLVCSRQIRHVVACLCSWRRRPALCLYLWNSRGNLSHSRAGSASQIKRRGLGFESQASLFSFAHCYVQFRSARHQNPSSAESIV